MLILKQRTASHSELDSESVCWKMLNQVQHDCIHFMLNITQTNLFINAL